MLNIFFLSPNSSSAVAQGGRSFSIGVTQINFESCKVFLACHFVPIRILLWAEAHYVSVDGPAKIKMS